MDALKAGFQRSVTGSLLSLRFPNDPSVPSAVAIEEITEPSAPAPAPAPAPELDVPVIEDEERINSSAGDTDVKIEMLGMEMNSLEEKKTEIPPILQGMSETEMEQLRLNMSTVLPESKIDKLEWVEMARQVNAQSRTDLVSLTDEGTPLAQVLSSLETHEERGLSQAQVERRVLEYGPNELIRAKATPFWLHFVMQFMNPLIVLLCFASIASIGVGHYPDGVAILLIVLLICLFGSITENSADQALQALADLSQPQARVTREGRSLVIPSAQIVPGDILSVQTGDIIPCDLRVIRPSELRINEMVLTGEPNDVSKTNSHSEKHKNSLTPANMCFMGTTVSSGHATGVAVAIGMKTRVGSIAELLLENEQEDNSAPPKTQPKLVGDKPRKPKRWYNRPLTQLQKSLRRLALILGSIGISVCILVFIIGTARGYRDPANPDTPTVLTMLVVAISLAVSSVPEGLPLVTTIGLALGSRHLARHNALIRRLPAVETLGALNVICSDKTGTLTEGRMTALKLFADFKLFDILGKGFVPMGAFQLQGKRLSTCEDDHSVMSTLASALLCGNTRLEQDPVNNKWHPKGNPSEAPLVVAAAKAGLWYENMTREYVRVDEVPFTSTRKMMATLHKVPDRDLLSPAGPQEMYGLKSMLYHFPLSKETSYVACIKGAPNYVLRLCTSAVDAGGNLTPLDLAKQEAVLRTVNELSSQALRVIAVALVPFDSCPYSLDDSSEHRPPIDDRFEKLTQKAVFCGLMASMDPERAGVQESIALAHGAGIRVVMITGDYLPTAVAIARNIGILHLGSDTDVEAVDCEKLRPSNEYLSHQDMDELTNKVCVFARAQPKDKLEIVKSFQRQHLVCAMTGDGVNDAPALRQADIGIAMGSGTAVAKGASQMVLLDDAFPTIVTAIEHGRIVYNNIQKFVTFFLATNAAQASAIFICVCAGIPLPLSALQILFINLATDDWSAISLTLEKGEGNIMQYPPRQIHAPLIHGLRVVMIAFHWLLLVSMIFLSYILGLYLHTGSILQEDIFPSHLTSDQITCHVFQSSGSWSTVVGKDCAIDGVAAARTIVFITICLSENLRVLSVRSFRSSIFTSFLHNKLMLASISSSVGLMLIVTLTPVRSIFGMTRIEPYSWLIAAGASVFTLICDEYLKSRLRARSEAKQRMRHVQNNFDMLLMEMKGLRQHIVNLESIVKKNNNLKID